MGGGFAGAVVVKGGGSDDEDDGSSFMVLFPLFMPDGPDSERLRAWSRCQSLEVLFCMLFTRVLPVVVIGFSNVGRDLISPRRR